MKLMCPIERLLYAQFYTPLYLVRDVTVAIEGKKNIASSPVQRVAKIHVP